MRLRRDPGREPGLDPQATRELEALDAALAGGPVEPQDEELAALAVALRDERPEPRPEFALDLDLRAREGFETTARAPRRPGRPARRVGSRRRWGLALGAAASLFIVATGVVGSGVLDSGDGGGGSSGTTEVFPAAPLKPESTGSAAPAVGGGAAQRDAQAVPAPTVSPQPDQGTAPRVRDRKVERGASLTLTTPRDRIEDVADGAIRVTDRHGGFVLRSSVAAGERGNPGASLDLRIPSTRLSAALADLSELAHVRSRVQTTDDITAAFTSPRRRLAGALAERRALLRQLARAVTPNETAAVRARLRAVNRRVDRAQSELRRLRERVTYSAVSVQIEPGRATPGAGGGWTLGDALDDALSVLRAMLGAALVALAVLIPAGILGGLGWLAYRGRLRRRRESALDV